MAGNESQVTVDVKGLERISQQVRTTLENVVQVAARNIEAEAKTLVPVDTGATRASIAVTIIDDGLGASIGPSTLYACVVGSQQMVYDPATGTADGIGWYRPEKVLSKDGQAHRIIEKHRFAPSEIEAVSIRTRHGRHPLLVTKEHLILIWREGQVIWEQAQSLTTADMVFGKRGHNSITDNSNKTSFLCHCGVIFWVLNSSLPHREVRFCSLECRHKYGPHDQNTGMHWSLSPEQRAKHAGEHNSHWRDGNAIRRYDSAFNGLLKATVKERDGFMCQQCENPFDLVVHHQDWDKMNSVLDNLITLCRSCHGQLHAQDCELPEVDLASFVPKPILSIEPQTIKRHPKGYGRLPMLYDFTVAEENSFMVAGILVHNSYLEYGTHNMPARPYMRPALENERQPFERAINAALQELAP